MNLLKDKCEIKYYKNKTTYDLLKNADLVICGFSTIAHEAAFLGIPSVRILDLENPYFHDLQDKIKMVHMPEQLEKILKKDDFQFFLSNSKNIERKFYNKLDNKAYIRFNRVLKNKWN